MLFYSRISLFPTGVLINMAQGNNGYQQLSEEIYSCIERRQGNREEAPLKMYTENNINQPKQPVFPEKITSFRRKTACKCLPLFFLVGILFVSVIPVQSRLFYLCNTRRNVRTITTVCTLCRYMQSCVSYR